jgi:hypothetical protein
MQAGPLKIRREKLFELGERRRGGFANLNGPVNPDGPSCNCTLLKEDVHNV